MEPVPKRQSGVPSCADALASLSTRRGSITPSAPSRQAEGGRWPAPFAAPRAAAPRPTSRPFPCLLSEPWRRWWGRSTALMMLVAMGGGALLSLSFEKKGGAAEICEDEVATSEGGRTAPVSPTYKEGGGGRSVFPNIETTHNLSHDAAFDTCRSGRARWIRSKIRRDPGHVCPCPVLGLAQQRSAPCVAQARGLLSVY